MRCRKQVREKEADSDGLIGPVEDMYALLGRYEVRLPAEELAAVSDLRYSWRKLLDLASATSDTLSQLQVAASVLQDSMAWGMEGEGEGKRRAFGRYL